MHPASMDPFDEDGILTQIRGDYIARALDMLPPPIAGEDTHATAEVEVPGIGRVRIRFELHSSRRGHSEHWFWTACYAELT